MSAVMRTKLFKTREKKIRFPGSGVGMLRAMPSLWLAKVLPYAAAAFYSGGSGLHTLAGLSEYAEESITPKPGKKRHFSGSATNRQLGFVNVAPSAWAYPERDVEKS